MLLWYFDCIEHRRIFHGHGCAFPASATDFHEPVFGEDGTLPDPTGFSTEPPLGPAIPVVANAYVDLARALAPSAIARATGSLTAPC